ncbi:MAG: tRNA guanosine(34) transglycosylase Tgt [Candidatus Buchananbacteria bacterium]|nr:tRNA guanosine(34) transglycosylase Tgt [Candidatus Buchananbacteria bacterium]
MANHFKILKKSKLSQARLSKLKTAHGIINAPFFMPIATRGAVKNLTVEEIKDLKAEIILSNTYHLLLRPGVALMKKYGGLHQFMRWSAPILTDSGGFQVFSLAKHRKITPQGVYFSDPQNGQKYYLTPQKAIQIQKAIGSDIMMVLDECPPYPVTEKYADESLELTTKWAALCKKEHQKKPNSQLLFAIVQGSTFKDLRIKSAKQLTAIGFDGYAIGGVAVGEPREKMKEVLNWTIPELPADKPRYLMGLGRPEEIVEAVKGGVDMFDCVIPTREARHGRLYIWKSQISNLKSQVFYRTININNAKFAKDLSSINNSNLKSYSKAYLHHLFKTNETLGMRLATLNNLNFYLTLMAEIRNNIKNGKL